MLAPARKMNFRGLLLSAVLLPVAIAAADYAILDHTFLSWNASPNLYAALQFGWYVVQIGVLGYVVGRSISHPTLRWVVFGWILLLVTLLTFTAAMAGSDGSSCLPPAALVGGQIGICIVWLFFGDTIWPLRIPLMVAGVVIIFALWLAAAEHYWNQMLNELLILQGTTLGVLCGILRLQRFQLGRIVLCAETTEQSQRRALQFNLKHVLIWTTGMAVLLGIGRAFDLLNWQAAERFTQGVLFWKGVLAIMSAVGIIVALWVALGRGHWAMRYSIGLLYLLAIGSGVSLWSKHNHNALQIGMRTWSRHEWELVKLYEVGWWWLGWLFLSAGLLASTLLILRTLEYRLVRRAKGG
jgi:hypothetical protein